MKKTSYQKLKHDNDKLKKEIYSILGENGFENQIISTAVWKMKIELEKQIWGGHRI